MLFEKLKFIDKYVSYYVQQPMAPIYVIKKDGGGERERERDRDRLFIKFLGKIAIY